MAKKGKRYRQAAELVAQAMEEAEMTPKEKRASLRQRGVGT